MPAAVKKQLIWESWAESGRTKTEFGYNFSLQVQVSVIDYWYLRRTYTNEGKQGEDEEW